MCFVLVNQGKVRKNRGHVVFGAMLVLSCRLSYVNIYVAYEIRVMFFYWRCILVVNIERTRLWEFLKQSTVWHHYFVSFFVFLPTAEAAFYVLLWEFCQEICLLAAFRRHIISWFMSWISMVIQVILYVTSCEPVILDCKLQLYIGWIALSPDSWYWPGLLLRLILSDNR